MSPDTAPDAPPDDKPERTVMFYRDRDEYVGVISNEEFVAE